MGQAPWWDAAFGTALPRLAQPASCGFGLLTHLDLRSGLESELIIPPTLLGQRNRSKASSSPVRCHLGSHLQPRPHPL